MEEALAQPNPIVGYADDDDFDQRRDKKRMDDSDDEYRGDSEEETRKPKKKKVGHPSAGLPVVPPTLHQCADITGLILYRVRPPRRASPRRPGPW